MSSSLKAIVAHISSKSAAPNAAANGFPVKLSVKTKEIDEPGDQYHYKVWRALLPGGRLDTTGYGHHDIIRILDLVNKAGDDVTRVKTFSQAMAKKITEPGKMRARAAGARALANLEEDPARKAAFEAAAQAFEAADKAFMEAPGSGGKYAEMLEVAKKHGFTKDLRSVSRQLTGLDSTGVVSLTIDLLTNGYQVRVYYPGIWGGDILSKKNLPDTIAVDEFLTQKRGEVQAAIQRGRPSPTAPNRSSSLQSLVAHVAQTSAISPDQYELLSSELEDLFHKYDTPWDSASPDGKAFAAAEAQLYAKYHITKAEYKAMEDGDSAGETLMETTDPE